MDVVPQNIHWLIPEEKSPCDILLHFRGQYAQALTSGQTVSLAVLEKLAKARYNSIYIKKSDLPAWEAWKAMRHPTTAPAAGATAETDKADENLYGNKRAELLSYMQKSINSRVDGNEQLSAAMNTSAVLIKKVIKHPMLDWYFKQFHEPPDLLQHNARVAYSTLIFSSLYSLGDEKALENIAFSAIIHELSGEPKESMKTVVSQQTIAHLEREQHPAPQEVIQLIRMHDELCSGKGFPDNKQRADIPPLVRVFTLFNHFDHYRLAANGTRRARYDQAKQKMSARAADYDPGLWPRFWDFWEKFMEPVT